MIDSRVRWPWTLPMVLLAWGCGGDDLSLPSAFTMTGEARGGDEEGRTADCLLDLRYELGDERHLSGGAVEYRGVYGGEMFRRVLEADGSGFAFFMDVHGEVEVRLLPPDRLEIVVPVAVDSDSRFWRELSRVEGVLGEDGHARGRWTCAPLDLDEGGYRDLSVVADGEWEIHPLSP